MENVSNSNEKTKFTSLFSKRLRETRNERGIKLKEFAEKIAHNLGLGVVFFSSRRY